MGARLLVGTFKLSMHKSGKWISAFTSESGIVLSETGWRRHHEWKRPPEFAPGWTHGPGVIVPWVAWRDDFSYQEPHPSDTEWVSGPNRNKMLTFDLLFSAASTSSDELISRSGGRMVGKSLPLSNGEAIWLLVKQVEISAVWKKWLEDEQRKFQVHYRGDLNTFQTAWIVLIVDSSLGVPLFVHFPLGRRHFSPDEGPSPTSDPSVPS